MLSDVCNTSHRVANIRVGESGLIPVPVVTGSLDYTDPDLSVNYGKESICDVIRAVYVL